MAVLELTPTDVSAAVQTDVTQLARKRLLPPQKRGVDPAAAAKPWATGGARAATPGSRALACPLLISPCLAAVPGEQPGARTPA